MSPTALSPAYSKYASSTTSGRASGSGGRSPSGLPGRQQKVSAGSVLADVSSGELGRDAKERIGRIRRDGHDVTRPCERARAEQNEVVRARAEHDVLGLDARVRGDRLVDQRIAAVRIRVHRSERSRDRARPRARER